MTGYLVFFSVLDSAAYDDVTDAGPTRRYRADVSKTAGDIKPAEKGVSTVLTVS